MVNPARRDKITVTFDLDLTFDLESYLRIWLTKLSRSICPILKIIVQMVMQFCMVIYLIAGSKSNRN